MRLCGLEVQPYYTLVADAPPRTAPKKIPTPEPKFAVVAISHVKGEFRYGSGMVELCLYDFNGPSPAFFGVPHFSVIPPTSPSNRPLTETELGTPLKRGQFLLFYGECAPAAPVVVW